jgi:glyoxylase-like metal-dependent hydrolase (beta-lactamase superfamily II)
MTFNMTATQIQTDAAEPKVHTIFEPVTGTWQYIVADPTSKKAVIIDSVLDFDPGSATISTKSANQLISVVNEYGYTVTHILETHAHADHLTASRYLQSQLSSASPIPIGIGKRITKVQDTFAARYAVPEEELSNAFEITFGDDESFDIGGVTAKVLHLPGHTPDHVGYQIGTNVFAGDSLFNPDVGSARCDFPGGSPTELFASMHKLLALPDHFKLYTGHDYPPEGREAKPYYTVAEQREQNKHVGKSVKEDDFVKWRAQRDGQLGEPRLLHQAIQVNIRGGRLPKKDADGIVMFMVPVKGIEKVKGVL